MSISEESTAAAVGQQRPRRGLQQGIVVALADRGIGAKQGLISVVALTGVVAIAAPHVRWLVPIGAPGSSLPGWILGPLASLASRSPLGSPWGPLLAWVMLLLLTLSWLLVLTGAEELSMKTLIWAITSVYLILLLAPPLLSTDVFTYLSAGRLQILHGVNPYLHGPVVQPQDPVFAWTGLVWCDTPTVYGPLFSYLSAGLAGFGLAVGLWTMKFIAAVAAAACAWLTWSIAKELGRPPKMAMLFVALNPVLLVHGVGGGHNDLLMLVAVLAAVRLVLASRPGQAGAAVAVAVAIKATAGLALPFVLIGSRRHAERGSRRAAIGFGIAAMILGVIGTISYGLSWLAIPITVSKGPSRHVGELESFPGMFSGYLHLGTLGTPARIVLGVSAVAVVLLALRYALKGGDNWIGATAISVAGALSLSTQLHAWYIVLALPFAALSDDRRVRRMAIALTVAVLLVTPAIRGMLPIGADWPYTG